VDLPLIQIIVGSTREQRRGAPIARWLAGLAEARSDLAVAVTDLADLDLPLLAHASPPMNDSSRDGAAHGWSQVVAAADGFVIVTPEYNHGYPAPLKNALDHLFSEWNRKPVAFVSYGGSGGGLRAVEQLRQVAIELEMVPIRRQVAIARVWSAIDEGGRLREPPTDEARALLDDLVWWATALRGGRLLGAAA